jgi:hypothetical protein
MLRFKITWNRFKGRLVRRRVEIERCGEELNRLKEEAR